VNDSQHGPPQRRGLAVKSCPFSSDANICTRKAPTDDVNGLQLIRVSCDCLDIAIPPRVRPMLGEHRPGIGRLFNLPDGTSSRDSRLESELKAADAGEERADLHGVSKSSKRAQYPLQRRGIVPHGPPLCFLTMTSATLSGDRASEQRRRPARGCRSRASPSTEGACPRVVHTAC